MQIAKPDGLHPASDVERAARCEIVTIYNTDEEAAGASVMEPDSPGSRPGASHGGHFVGALIKLWATKKAEEAFVALSKPDVTVTNASDKRNQLPKILEFQGRVQSAFAAQAHTEV